MQQVDVAMETDQMSPKKEGAQPGESAGRG